MWKDYRGLTDASEHVRKLRKGRFDVI
jgi:hypothetical protein